MSGAVALAMTGASGGAYGLRLLECLLDAGQRVQLMVSEPARMVLAMECGLKAPSRPAGMREALAVHLGRSPDGLEVYGREDWTAPLASGSNPPRAMAVCPCTTGTLGGIAAGTSRNLVERAADVALKERRPLVLVVRETPLSVIHLENMLRLARAGAIVLPANPGFYHRPERASELVDFVVARVLDHLGVAAELLPRWGDAPRESGDDDGG